MSIFSKIAEAIGGPVAGFVEAIFGGIDSLSTTEEEKLALKATIQAQQNQLVIELAKIEADTIEQQASIIRAEATQGNFLQKSWRPITMLSFLGLLQPDNMTQETINAVFDLLKIGIGGYIVGRSVEKGLVTWKNGNSE